MFYGNKAFQGFNLKKENNVMGFVKRNPLLLLLMVLTAISFLIPEAHAAGLSPFSNNLKSKIQTIQTWVQAFAGVSLLIGFCFLVIFYIRGDFKRCLAIFCCLVGIFLCFLIISMAV